LAATRRSEGEVRTLRDAIEVVSVAIMSGESAEDADYVFHITIMRATRNPFFAEVLKPLGSALINAPVVPPQAMGAPARARYLRALHREHSAILEAIETRDAEAARRAARRHILRGEARFRAALPDAS
jgi:DNA-binding FadR family transcriptional regulator